MQEENQTDCRNFHDRFQPEPTIAHFKARLHICSFKAGFRIYIHKVGLQYMFIK